MTISQSCLECKTMFDSSRKDKKFCSRKCARKNYNYTFVELCCPKCNISFKLEKSDFDTRKRRGYETIFCSKGCSSIHTNQNRYEKRLLKCLNCSKEEVVNESDCRDKYCSMECYKEGDKERIALWAAQMGKESAEKISKTHKERYANGAIHPWTGRHHSEKTKDKISNSREIYYETHDGYWKGKNLPLETCEKISNTRSARWVAGEYNDSFAKGKIFSKKMNCELYYASSWEKVYMEYLDCLDEVKTIRKDELRVKYVDSQQHKRNYIVDLLVEYVDKKKVIYEIKPKWFVNYDINQRKFAAAREYCKQNNMTFEIITEIELEKLGIQV